MTDEIKRFDLIVLPADITPAFKERVFNLFKAYYCVYSPEWHERTDTKDAKLLVLTSQNLGGRSELDRCSLSAMADGLKAGYEEGVKAPKPKPLTKLQRATALYKEVHGRRDTFVGRAQSELGMTSAAAFVYYQNLRSTLRPGD